VLKKCSACGAVVQRKDCHKNRYGEYICRECQAKGVLFTPRRRLLRDGKKWLIRFLLMLVATGAVTLFFWWIGQLFPVTVLFDARN
jgi:hypothetical protein